MSFVPEFLSAGTWSQWSVSFCRGQRPRIRKPLQVEKKVHLQASESCRMVCAWAWRRSTDEKTPLSDADGLQNPPFVIIKVAREHYVAGLLSKLAEEVCEICLEEE